MRGSRSPEFTGKKWEFDKFISYAEDVLRKHQSTADLLQDPPEIDKYVKYVPAYSPHKAYKKFLKSQKTPKPEGWLEVEPREGGYPKTIIATQVKGDSLAPIFENNTWILLNTSIDQKKLNGQIALVHNGTIQDGYEGNLTIRKIEIKEKEVPGRIFGERFVYLSAINPEISNIELNVEQKGDVEPVAVLFQ